MADTTRRQVELAMRVTAEGEDKLDALSDDLRDLGAEGKNLAPALEQVPAALQHLAAEAQQAAKATQEARAAQAAAQRDYKAAQKAAEDQADALKILRAQIRAGVGDTEALRQQEKALALAATEAQVAVRAKKRAFDEASGAARAAAKTQGDLTEQLQRTSTAARKAGDDVQQVGRNVASASDLIRQIGPLMAGAFSAQQFVQTIAESESLARSFEAIFGSAQKAREELDFIKGTANRLGLENRALATSYQSLAAATKGTTLEGQATRDVFEAVARAMGTLGKSTAETDRALVAIAQMASKGTASMEELRGQLGEALPGAMQAAAAGAGITVQQLTELVSSGTVLASDVLPALTKGLNDLYGKAAPPDNIISNWNRLKNTINEAAVAIGEGGASKGITKALSGAAMAMQGASAAVDILGTGIGETAAAIVNWNFDVSQGEELANRYADGLRRTGEQAGFFEKEQTKATAAMQAGAKAAQDLHRETERQFRQQEATRESMIAARVAYADMAKAATDATEVTERQTKARLAEMEVLSRLVGVYGSEVEQRRVAIEVTSSQAAAAELLARRRETEAIIANSFLIKLKEEAQARNDTTEATKKEIEAAGNSAKSKDAAAQAAKANAAAKRIEAEAAKAAAEALKDNAARVTELRGAMEVASAEVEKFTRLQAQGKATDEQVASARARAAAATYLYRDALRDAVTAAERRLSSDRQMAQVTAGITSVEVERARAAREVALANGDATRASELARAESNLAVQQAVEAYDAAIREAQGLREVALRKESEAQATRTLTAEKREEIDAIRRSADLKDQEAQKADILAGKLRALADSERSRMAALEQSIALQEQQVALLERQRALEERKRTAYDTAGNVVNASIDTPTSVQNTLKGYGLSDAQAAQLARQFFNGNGTLNYGAGNSMGQTSLSETLRVLAERTQGSAPGAAGAAIGGARTVNVNIGGQKHSFDVASQADSDAAVSMLRSLETQSSRSIA